MKAQKSLKNNKKTVIHIVNTGKFSGAERVVIQIITNMRKIYSDIHFIYAGRNGEIENILKNYNIDYYNINTRNPLEIRKMIKNIKPDIIHTHDFSASFFISISSEKIPIISHIHNNPPWLKNKGIKSLMFLFSIKRSKKVLVVSKAVIEEYCYKNKLIKKALVISNPLNINDIQGRLEKNLITTKKYDIIFVGRLTYQKDPLRFIKLIKALKDKLSSISVIMVGDGELREECLREIKDNGLEENISIAGFVMNPYNIMAESKLLCIPSKWEGFGLVIFEAFSCGLPVVGSNAGGIPDLINDSCGKVCRTDEEYVEEIFRLLTDNQYLEYKSENAVSRAYELNNIEKYIKDIEEIYKEIPEV